MIFIPTINFLNTSNNFDIKKQLFIQIFLELIMDCSRGITSLSWIANKKLASMVDHGWLRKRVQICGPHRLENTCLLGS